MSNIIEELTPDIFFQDYDMVNDNEEDGEEYFESGYIECDICKKTKINTLEKLEDTSEIVGRDMFLCDDCKKTYEIGYQCIKILVSK